MKQLAILLGAFLFFAPSKGSAANDKKPFIGHSHSHSRHHHHHHHSSSSSSSSSDFEKIIGTFTIIGFGEHDSVQLSSTTIYQPVNKRYKKQVSDNWSLGDSVEVVQSSHKHIYILTDLATGNVIKAKILHLD